MDRRNLILGGTLILGLFGVVAAFVAGALLSALAQEWALAATAIVMAFGSAWGAMALLFALIHVIREDRHGDAG